MITEEKLIEGKVRVLQGANELYHNIGKFIENADYDTAIETVAILQANLSALLVIEQMLE